MEKAKKMIREIPGGLELIHKNKFLRLVLDPKFIEEIDKENEILIDNSYYFDDEIKDIFRKIIGSYLYCRDKVDEENNDIIMVALSHGQYEIATMIAWRRKFNNEHKNKFGESALILAVKTKQREIIKILLSWGINPDIRDNMGRTALIWGVFLQEEEIVKDILNKDVCNVNIVDNDKRTALHYAVLNNKEEIVRDLLFQENCETNIPDKNGDTPIIIAIINKYEAIGIILASFSDANTKDKNGNTLIMYAILAKSIKLVRSLLIYDCDLNCSNNEGLTIEDYLEHVNDKGISNLIDKHRKIKNCMKFAI
jgi:ankyrin repeat protein